MAKAYPDSMTKPEPGRDAITEPEKPKVPQSWTQIIELYGGPCSYLLAAQSSTTHRYSAYSEKISLSPGRGRRGKT